MFSFGASVCFGILLTNICMKFFVGGWETVAVTSLLVAVAFLIHAYYRGLEEKLKKLDDTLATLVTLPTPNEAAPDPAKPTAVILVPGYNGLGVHTMLDSLHFAPGRYRQPGVRLPMGVVDSKRQLQGQRSGRGPPRAYGGDLAGKYVTLARGLGMPAVSYSSIGTDVVDELEKLLACK